MSKLFNRIGRRGFFLLLLSLMLLNAAYNLFEPTDRALSLPMYIFVSTIMPLDIWALLHLVAGLVSLFYVFKPKDGIGYGVVMGVIMLWALLAMLGWIFADVERGYSTAIIYLVFCTAIGLIGTWYDPGRDELR